MAEMQPPTKSSFILENGMYSSTMIFVCKCNANEKRKRMKEKKSKIEQNRLADNSCTFPTRLMIICTINSKTTSIQNTSILISL